jgi:hypothetical protein
MVRGRNSVGSTENLEQHNWQFPDVPKYGIHQLKEENTIAGKSITCIGTAWTFIPTFILAESINDRAKD